MEGLSLCLVLSLLVLALEVSQVYNLCEKKEVQGDLSIAGHQPMHVRYNVCVDNTTITPQPSLIKTGIATFIRDCCGCRVSSVSERELRIHTLEPSSQSRSIYVPEIRSCECIPCDASVYTWADYFLFMNHKRRK